MNERDGHRMRRDPANATHLEPDHAKAGIRPAATAVAARQHESPAIERMADDVCTRSGWRLLTRALCWSSGGPRCRQQGGALPSTFEESIKKLEEELSLKIGVAKEESMLGTAGPLRKPNTTTWQ